MKRVGFFKNAYRNVHKAYVDRRTTQSEFCFEINILCEVRSGEDGTSNQGHVKVGKQTAERLPISSSFTLI